MSVKLPLRDLNSGSCPPQSHPTSTNTCGVTIAPKVCDGFSLSFLQILFQSQVIYFGNSEKNVFHLIIYNIFVSLYLSPSFIWLVIIINS